MKGFVLGIIRLYQKTLSFDHGIIGKVFGERFCRFYPSCSEYTRQAVEKYGVVQGGKKGVRRIIRCHPWSDGGYDPLV